MNFKLGNLKLSTIAIAITSSLFSNISVANTETALEVITVKGDFHESSLQTNPSAISLLTEQDIARRNAQNLEEIIAISPNVNFASGSQRARYYQIRGIGERSQFQEPINPSVGVIIDGVDFTGIGSVSSMFDVDQVEIFRGPQGTRFGANALAGVVNITTNAPRSTKEGMLKATVGNYGSKGLGMAISGPASDKVSYRLTAEQYQSDGFVENIHLNKDDTNNRDELSIRGKLAIEATKDLTIDLTVLHFDFDNGYDAFSLDNNRNTYSDQPGFDTQKTTALATTFTYQGLQAADVQLMLSIADSDLAYGYDEDWAFGDYDWDTGACITPSGCLADSWGYSSTDHYFREKDTRTAELRFSNKAGNEIFNGTTSWVTGFYYKSDKSDLTRIYTWDADFSSDFDTKTYAVYGQLDTQLTPLLTLTTGLRVEDRDADYDNSNAFQATPSDTMVGGKVVLAYQYTDNSMFYSSINRGYKAGGVNTDGTLTDEQREFEPEYLWNYEVGYKANYFDNSVYLRASAFYMDRDDIQVKISHPIDGTVEFIEYLDNASAGSNIGLELESGWKINENVELYGSLGLLDTEYKSFSYLTEEGEKSLSGRDQAHAPAYQFNLGVNYFINDAWKVNVSVEGKDEFYFSDSHDQKSDAYELLNASISYNQADWELIVWGRNLTDEDYQTRGFYFGNDPRDGYTDKAYYQLAEPAVFGATFNYHF